MNLLKRCSQLFFTQMFAYCVVCVSFIAMNRGNYILTFVTDVGCGLNSYFLIRRVAQAKGRRPHRHGELHPRRSHRLDHRHVAREALPCLNHKEQ
jgi:hypothetical protein